MNFHPDVLAAHAEFGGDLESMQKLYEYPDLKAEVERLRALLSESQDMHLSAVRLCCVLRDALGSASDLLAERKFGSPARSPAHNARVVMEYALQTTTGTTGGDVD